MTDSWDEAKRRRTLAERGLDFADAEQVLAGRRQYTRRDDRREYGEPRFITVGFLRDRFVAVVWTPRDEGRHIISMRYGHAREKARFEKYLD